MSEFIVLVNGQLETYENYEDIPAEFDHVIKFAPDVVAGPHTEQQHHELDVWNVRLQKLMEVERARSRQSR